jgi:hypothetical protein
MACSDYSSLQDILVDFSQPPDAVVCPFAGDAGLGIGIALFGMFVFSFVGLGLSIRTQHPAPVLVTGILSAAVVAANVPGQVTSVIAIIIFFLLAGAGMIIYQSAQSSL